jgi:hypothetical protein
MMPLGLTMKKSRNKYRHEPRGELMLIHECVECKSLSINRIAADDIPDTIAEVFRESFSLSQSVLAACETRGIDILRAEAADLLNLQLYGRITEVAVSMW